jgi:galactonate dehydratase
MINRRSLLKCLAAGAGAALFPATRSEAALPKAKITRVKCWAHPSMNRSFSQSGMLVTVETDIGITGIGEGGSPDLIQDLAGSLIGKNPFEIEKIWHHMYMDRFYPPGREKIHGQGALDMALWDIKGKALQLPLYDLLHGTTRTHVECYATTFRPAGEAPPGRGAGPAAVQAQPGAGRGGGGGGNSGAALRDRARAAMEA